MLLRRSCCRQKDAKKASDDNRSAMPFAWRNWSARNPVVRPTRAVFVDFVLSILQNCDHSLLTSVLRLRPLMGGLLNHLGADPPSGIVRVLTTLAQRVLSPRSGISPKLQSEPFSDVALQQVRRA